MSGSAVSGCSPTVFRQGAHGLGTIEIARGPHGYRTHGVLMKITARPIGGTLPGAPSAETIETAALGV